MVSRKICIKRLRLVIKSVILTEIYGKPFSYQGKYSCTKLGWYFEHFKACVNVFHLVSNYSNEENTKNGMKNNRTQCRNYRILLSRFLTMIS